MILRKNKPFPRYLVPPCQTEFSCKMSLICTRINVMGGTHFHMNGLIRTEICFDSAAKGNSDMVYIPGRLAYERGEGACRLA